MSKVTQKQMILAMSANNPDLTAREIAAQVRLAKPDSKCSHLYVHHVLRSHRLQEDYELIEDYLVDKIKKREKEIVTLKKANANKQETIRELRSERDGFKSSANMLEEQIAHLENRLKNQRNSLKRAHEKEDSLKKELETKNNDLALCVRESAKLEKRSIWSRLRF